VARRRTRLKTIGHILTELGRHYRRADAGELNWADAAAASRVLREMRHLLETSDIEQRLQRLEEAAASDPDWPRASANGRGRYAPH
jgi:hypothetical protein